MDAAPRFGVKTEPGHCAGIPDMRFINRNIPIKDIARALELRLDGAGKIHCWHPERHQHGDRTASVGIRTSNNTAKCFGCDSKPMGPIDLLMDVQGLRSAADAALWIAEHFNVPVIPARKRLTDAARLRTRVGYEQGLELLTRSGLWGELSMAARSIAPVLLAFGEKQSPLDQELTVRISYVGISRYSGVRSPNAIRKALFELGEIGFLKSPEAGLRRSPSRNAASYVVTPNSNELLETANAFAERMRTEISAERELRARLRQHRIQVLRQQSTKFQ